MTQLPHELLAAINCPDSLPVGPQILTPFALQQLLQMARQGGQAETPAVDLIAVCQRR